MGWLVKWIFHGGFSQMDVLKKYDELKLTKQRYFALIPKTIFIDGLSAQAIGLYAYLVFKSAPQTQFNGKQGWQNVSFRYICQDLSLSNKNAQNTNSYAVKGIQNTLNELEEAGYITTNHYKWISKTWFNVIINPVDKSDGFATLYPNVMNQLLNRADRGSNTLKRFALYVAMRSCTFSNDDSSKVIGATPTYLGNMIGLSASTVFRHFVWMRKHNIVAYYHVRLNNASGTTKYYYADINDHKMLTKTIKNKIKHKRVLKVLD